MTAHLEELFHEEMLALYRRTGEATGYWATRYLQKVRRVGGLKAAQDWLKPKIDSTSGLQRLIEENRIDLSLEALVLRQPWSSLFTSQELQTAQKRLNIATSSYCAEEVLENPDVLFEGAATQVRVNSYERNPIARKRCLEHHGSSCCICDFNFGEVFGELADGFIHVHHLVPLSEINEEYQVDPVRDLRPVCPNCHAMIHLGGQNRAIEDVKALLVKSSTTPKQ